MFTLMQGLSNLGRCPTTGIEPQGDSSEPEATGNAISQAHLIKGRSSSALSSM
ncbi:hypothetical protein [Thermostichus vulcanus]|uniref:Uncharacterized protein n=1 Tax=Thermostichus vulcanus str. 'Rupite' TaxID=2813851 RepID=A0ABT0CD16_THEVL|nr:hypothetical protein [Thermostichus vulcanus]MCJ2543680.1 hypothetical protein [Thermostichus vulcanus str. 'Rupite']